MYLELFCRSPPDRVRGKLRAQAAGRSRRGVAPTLRLRDQRSLRSARTV